MPLLLEDVGGSWLVNAGSMMLAGMTVMWISQIISLGCGRDRQGEDALRRKARKARKAKKVKTINGAKPSFSKFETTGKPGGIEQTLTFVEYPVSQLPQGDLEMHTPLNRHTALLQRIFTHQGDIADLNREIENLTRVVFLTPPDHPDTFLNLNNLVAMFHKRFQHLGDLSDIDKAIKYNTLAVSLAPPDHVGLPALLHNLGSVLYNRFERLGEPPDLEKALEYSTRAASLTSQGHFSMPALLNGLGLLHHSRFKRLGELSDLDKSITYLNQAAALTPENMTLMAGVFNNLGLLLLDRFKRLGDLSDLTKAIEYGTRAISVTPQAHHQMALSLNNLGSSLNIRYERLGELSDLDKATEYLTQAVSLMPKDHPGNVLLLNNLGQSLWERFRYSKELSDLDKAIEYQRQAMFVAPQGDTFLPVLLTNIGSSFHSRFRHLDELPDLDEAIKYSSEAIVLTPKGHSLMPACLYKLGLLYLSRSQHSDINNNVGQALDCFQKAAESAVGNPTDRFNSARQWASLCAEHHIPSLLQAHQRVMSLLPQLVWLGTTVDARYKYVLEAGDVSTKAAAAAISMEDYRLAIEWLEEGRLIVWKQMLQLRTPIDDLSAVAPRLAAELKQVACSLEDASSPRLASVVEDTTALEHSTQRHHYLAERWQELLDEVRNLPGFDSFLQPQKATDLMRSAQSGPIVIINVHQSRCDALIIKPGVTTISHIPLRLTFETAERSRTQLRHFVSSRGLLSRGVISGNPSQGNPLSRILLVLWTEVVKPVLVHLGYTTNSAVGDLPHVTWCTTGPLSFLPLHAAGDYASQCRIFDYVVSSYTPTLSAMLSPPINPTLFSGILAVGQSTTIDMPPLPGTMTELSRIQENSKNIVFTPLDGELATPIEVLAKMEEHSWVHLACHAKQDAAHPLKSAFYLHGGMLNLVSIMQQELKHVDLAFLSACQTATGDEDLPEEAVHLAAGMLMVGYRGVIATMWSIGDQDAPLVAGKVYEHLLEGGKPDARRAAVAVHRATACLREKVGVNAFEKWVPYIHIGL